MAPSPVRVELAPDNGSVRQWPSVRDPIDPPRHALLTDLDLLGRDGCTLATSSTDASDAGVVGIDGLGLLTTIPGAHAAALGGDHERHEQAAGDVLEVVGVNGHE